MRNLLAVMVALALAASSDASAGGRRGSSGSGSRYGTGSSSSSHPVRGYTTKRGTYVQPHHQTNSDRTQRNNYSAKGNVNPWTGSVGRKPVTR